MRNTFSFVRCTPTPWGLHWVNPSWRDRFWLDDSLLDWAFTHANFVVGFDGQAVPSDMRALRLLIARPSNDEQLDEWQQLAVVKGNLGELPDDVLDNFKRQGESHDVVVSWIAAGLWEAVKPLLHDGSAEQWQVQQSGTCIVIRRDASIRWEGPGRFVPVPSVEYVVRLVEQLGDGKFRRVPWQQSSAEKIAERLKQRLGEEAAKAPPAALPQA